MSQPASQSPGPPNMEEAETPLREVPRVTDPAAPHWVVKCLTKRGPTEFTSRFLFMHPTREQAEGEARRLVGKFKGKRFGVYQIVEVFGPDDAAL